MKNKLKKRIIIPLISVLLIAAASVLLADFLHPRGQAPEPVPAVSPDPIPAGTPSAAVVITPAPENIEDPTEAAEDAADDGLPHDRLFITVERQEYRRDDMRLVIPRLDLDQGIGDGTSQAELKLGPCLYEYAQLPGEGNRNVSIAGHRIKKDFYALDEMVEGDYLYLVWGGAVYRYVYESTTVVEQDDWGPIYSQGYSLVTLTTCTPIGVSDHRMIVRFKLDEIFEHTDDFVFDSAVPAESADA